MQILDIWILMKWYSKFKEHDLLNDQTCLWFWIIEVDNLENIGKTLSKMIRHGMMNSINFKVD